MASRSDLTEQKLTLKVGGADFGTDYIQKMIYSPEKVWSSNTRRNSSGKMTGKIVALKWKLEISFTPNIPIDTLDAIMDKVNSNQEWWTVEFADALGNKLTKTMYFGNPSYEPILYTPNGNGEYRIIYQSASVSLIER